MDGYARARLAGNPVIALLVGKAMSGAFLAHGYQAQRIIALRDPGVMVHAMGKAAAARIVALGRWQQAANAGTLLSSPYEKTVQSVEGGQLLFTLQSDGFVDTLGQAISTSDACTGTLIDQLTLRTGQEVREAAGARHVACSSARSRTGTAWRSR